MDLKCSIIFTLHKYKSQNTARSDPSRPHPLNPSNSPITSREFFLDFPAAFHPSITKFSASLEDLKRKFPFRL